MNQADFKDLMEQLQSGKNIIGGEIRFTITDNCNRFDLGTAVCRIERWEPPDEAAKLEAMKRRVRERPMTRERALELARKLYFVPEFPVAAIADTILAAVAEDAKEADTIVRMQAAVILQLRIADEIRKLGTTPQSQPESPSRLSEELRRIQEWPDWLPKPQP